VRSVLLVAAMGVGMALVAPGAAEAQDVAQDSVEGTATACLQPTSGCLSPPPGQFGLTLRLSAAARSGPSGEQPAGTMIWDEREIGLFIHSETQVSCLSVSGHVAVIGVGGTTAFTGSFGTISGISVAGLIRVTDGGGPDSRLDTFEFGIRQNPFPPFPPVPPPIPPPTDCSAFPAGLTAFTNEGGDLRVTDAQPFPTTKDQCKNGGWRNYGVFKNQGDCVSFVATRGKNPPGGG
jgi:hypothetical protein